ncbi:MAG: hypothetical protein GX639_06205 [Fibrobacter sp.]|nr:hypothetical protein [Fibrobacter sp.]
MIKYKPTNIKLYEPGLDQALKGKGVVRLTFDNEDNLNVTESEFVYLTVFDSLTNENYFEYRIGRKLNENNERIEFYTTKLDSVFKNMEYKIVNENYKNFIPRADFPFVFKVYPLADKE